MKFPFNRKILNIKMDSPTTCRHCRAKFKLFKGKQYYFKAFCRFQGSKKQFYLLVFSEKCNKIYCGTSGRVSLHISID